MGKGALDQVTEEDVAATPDANGPRDAERGGNRQSPTTARQDGRRAGKTRASKKSSRTGPGQPEGPRARGDAPTTVLRTTQ